MSDYIFNLIFDTRRKEYIIILEIKLGSYVYDTETGLYYLQSRYYDPEIGRFINADAFAATGQGVLGNNMFAYCGNNPVNGYDPTGHLRFDVATCSIGDANWGRRHAASMEPIYYMADGVINGQGAFKFSQTAFGMGSYAHNGCGAIAIYNAMQLLGMDASLGMITDQIINKHGLCIGGFFGVNASVIDDVLVERGVSCTGYWSSNDLMQNVHEGSVVIIYALNNVDNIFGGLHYIAAQYVDGRFLVYNVYGKSTRTFEAYNISRPYDNAGYLYGYIVGG